MIKRIIERCLESCGLRICNLQRMPFGVDFVNDVRRLAGTDPVRVIFDVGANVGQSAVHFARSFPGSVILSFEPELEVYERLRQNVRSLPCVRPYNLALGRREGMAMMYRPDDSPMCTLRVPAGETGMRTMETAVATIDSLCRSEHIDRIDVLKTDTEGYDLEVLQGAERLLAERRVRFVCSECEFLPSDRDSHTNFFELYDYMVRCGYCLIGLSTENVVPSRGLDWGNALFVPAGNQCAQK